MQALDFESEMPERNQEVKKQQQVTEEAKKSDFMTKAHEYFFNIQFNVATYLTAPTKNFIKEFDTVYFFGQKFKTNLQIQQKNYQLLRRFEETIWITYRKEFYPLLGDNKDYLGKLYTSDAGWGCMVRAGQNIMAEALRRHIKKFNNQKRLLKSILLAFADDTEQSFFQRCRQMSTQGQQQEGRKFQQVGNFSIQQIAHIAYADYGQVPGVWYTPSMICYILETIQNQNPIEQASNLVVKVFSSDRALIFTQAIERITGKQLEPCCSQESVPCWVKACICQQCITNRSEEENKNHINIFSSSDSGNGFPVTQKHQLSDDFEIIDTNSKKSQKMELDEDIEIIEDELLSDSPKNTQSLTSSQYNNQLQPNHCPTCINEQNTQKQQLIEPLLTPCQEAALTEQQKEKAILIFIVCQIGLDRPDPSYLQVCLELMDSQFSVGMVGGSTNKALYYLGRINDELIYLDPHYVQQGVNASNIDSREIYDTFFCKNLQTMGSQYIDTSLALSFYMRDFEELQKFYNYMEEMKIQHGDNLFFVVEKYVPDYMRQIEQDTSKIEIREGYEDYEIIG